MTGPGSIGEPRIRVYDIVAQGSTQKGMDAAAGRHLDLPVAELARLLEMLGADGLTAFCLYLEHLEQVPGVDGELTLGVPHFSARWLLAASQEASERTGSQALSKSAATRGHQAVERSGLLRAVANPPVVAGQGARGRTWRAVLNPRLIVLHGGRDDLGDVPAVRRGRPSKQAQIPVSRFPSKWDKGAGEPVSGKAGNGGAGQVSRDPRILESGMAEPVFALVSAASPGSSEAATSAVGVVHQLLSEQGRPGLIATGLVPALGSDRALVVSRLRLLFNERPISERAAGIVTALMLPTEETRRPDVLSELIAATVLGERDAAADLARLGVSGKPTLTAVELQERLVVGWLIGWGLRQVGSWGAWLHQATRPDWSPKPGPLLNQFLELVRSLRSGAEIRPVHAVRPSAVIGALEAPGLQPRLEPATDGELLPDDTVRRHFAAARQKWPMFCRDGSAQAADPVWRSRLVRMYLAAEERHTEVETTEQAAGR